MDFNFPAENDPRRIEVRAWFEAHPDPTADQMYEAGYMCPRWPRPYGLAADPELQLIIADELKRAGVTIPENFLMENHLGISLLSHGSEAAKARHLIKGLKGEERWVQLFSEPSCGSDLANLRTTATRDGDHYVIQGSKIWNSGAHYREVGCLLARTDPNAQKHAGLSQFVVPMDTPGITVRPLYDMSGHHEVNEVFLENVRIPVDARLGEEGEGWQLTNQQLQSERVSWHEPAGMISAGPTARHLVDALNRSGALLRPEFRDEAAQLYIEGELLRLLAMRSLTDRINNKQAGREAAVSKMMRAQHGQRIYQLALRALGHSGLDEDAPAFEGSAQFDGRASWKNGPWFSPSITLMAGSQQIMKNVVGERLLGLPRDSDPTAKGSWLEHRNAS